MVTLPDKFEQRACTECCVKLSKSDILTLTRFLQSLDDYCFGRTQVSEWHVHFKEGEIYLEYNQPAKRQKSRGKKVVTHP